MVILLFFNKFHILYNQKHTYRVVITNAMNTTHQTYQQKLKHYLFQLLA
jgi:hypothetical protein